MTFGIAGTCRWEHVCVREWTDAALASEIALAHEPTQKFPLVHAVLEGLAPVDEYDRNFIVELPAQFGVAIHVDFVPREPSAARELREAFLHHLAEVTTLARIDYDLAAILHAAIVPLPYHPLARKNRQTDWSYHFTGSPPNKSAGVESENASSRSQAATG